jgi:uncharacterized protein (DUF2141 family)
MTYARGSKFGFAWWSMARPSLIALSSLIAFANVSAIADDETHRTLALDVTILTRSNDGQVFCALWPDAEGFPIQHDHVAHDGMSNEPEGRRAHIRFAAIVQGEYALACFHDENNNNTLDTDFVGIPSEGTGASNSARGFMGPPSYEDARFVVSQSGPDALTVQIDY